MARNEAQYLWRTMCRLKLIVQEVGCKAVSNEHPQIRQPICCKAGNPHPQSGSTNSTSEPRHSSGWSSLAPPPPSPASQPSLPPRDAEKIPQIASGKQGKHCKLGWLDGALARFRESARVLSKLRPLAPPICQKQSSTKCGQVRNGSRGPGNLNS